MSDFKFSARASLLGFDDWFVAHPRSRWCGTKYWLCTESTAVPRRVRESKRQIKMSPTRIAGVVRPVSECRAAGRVLPVSFGEPFNRGRGGAWVRPVKIARSSLLEASLLSLGVNASFLEWVERHVAPGSWHMAIDSCVLFHLRGSVIDAVIMPVRLLPRELLEVHGVSA